MAVTQRRVVLIKGSSFIRYRLLVADDRLYGLYVAGTEKDVDSDEAGAFFGSFRLR